MEALRRERIVGRRDDGFSLIEMLVILALISIATVVSLSFLPRRDTATAPAYAAQIAEMFTGARISAIARSRQETVTLDMDRKEVRFPGRDAIVALPPAIAMTALMGRELLLTDRSGAVLFFPDGGSSGTQLTLDDGRRQAVVRVNWLTGIATVRHSDE